MQITIDTHSDRNALPLVAAFLIGLSGGEFAAAVQAPESSAAPSPEPTASTVESPAVEQPAPSTVATTDEVETQRRKRRTKAEIEAEARAKAEAAQPVVQESAAAVVETPAPAAAAAATETFTKEQVTSRLGELLAAKGMPTCKAVLTEFNVAGVGGLKVEQYPAFMTAMNKAFNEVTGGAA